MRVRSEMNLEDLTSFDDEGHVRVVVESPAGARVKLKYNPRFGLMEWVRPLPLGLQFPYDWGFVPGTHAADGDPLDAFVLGDAPTAPGVLIACRALGVIELEQNGAGGRVRNDRIVARPANAARHDVKTLDDVPDRVLSEIEAFLLALTAFDNKHVVLLGRAGPEAVPALIGQAMQNTPGIAPRRVEGRR